VGLGKFHRRSISPNPISTKNWQKTSTDGKFRNNKFSEKFEKNKNLVNFPFGEIFHCRWNFPLVIFSVGEILRRWNFPSGKFLVGEMGLCEMGRRWIFYLWNVPKPFLWDLHFFWGTIRALFHFCSPKLTFLWLNTVTCCLDRVKNSSVFSASGTMIAVSVSFYNFLKSWILFIIILVSSWLLTYKCTYTLNKLPL
jgi:hypothetical protein